MSVSFEEYKDLLRSKEELASKLDEALDLLSYLNCPNCKGKFGQDTCQLDWHHRVHKLFVDTDADRDPVFKRARVHSI